MSSTPGIPVGRSAKSPERVESCFGTTGGWNEVNLSMLVAILADLHANLEATEAVLRKLDEASPDRVVCLGDLAGYNANPNEVIDLIREREIPCLMGNHDAAASGLEEPWFFNTRAQAAIRWQAERLRDDNRRWLRSLPEHLHFDDGCVGVHGAPGHRDDYIMDWLDAARQTEHLRRMGARLCFFGHSHRPSLFAEVGSGGDPRELERYSLNGRHRFFVNPGSVGQPRDHDPRAAFGLFDTTRLTFSFRRVEYDVEATARKIEAAGLPRELGTRLCLGR